MEEGNILLIFQLINGLDNSFNSLEKAYASKDKELFEKSSLALLELQKKIGFLLK